MSIELLIEIGKQIVLLGGLAVAGGVITSGFTEVLKLNAIKVPAQKYPELTAGVISVVLSAVAVFSLNAVVFETWASWAIVSGATLLSAMKSYDWILKGLYARFKKDA